MKRLRAGFFLAVLILLPEWAWSARIGDLIDTDFSEQALRFFSLTDPSVRWGLLGSILLGLVCGVMGSFLVVRKMALMSDALAHAVLPGVALGFLWNMEKNALSIFIGAVLAGLAGAWVVQRIRQTTKHKEDAALGFVLASFFAAGVCLVTMIQNLPGASKSGLTQFLFGQAAALGSSEVLLLAVVGGLVLFLVILFYKELLVTSFDPAFAASTGLWVTWIQYGIILLLAFAIVASLQAVGVVLITAMLVIPAATAYLLTDRFNRMLGLSAAFGITAGIGGAFFSFVGRNLPTGPLMVLAAAGLFTGAFLFGPRHGVAVRWWKQLSRSKRIARENTLKALYHLLEREEFRTETTLIRELAEFRKTTIDDAEKTLKALRSHGLATISEATGGVQLTPSGWQRACEIVRNHRLWELYLANAANFSPDHVHDEAEKIEHLLGEDTVRQLERRLNFANKDPHGKLIPGWEDIHGRSPMKPGGSALGFGKDRKP